jgi:Bacterial protein of unknown function (DUF885)
MNEVRQFQRIADAFLDQWFSLFPQDASELGLREFEPYLGENDAQLHRRYVRLLQDTLQQVESLSDHAFSGDQWIDRRGFLSLLRTRFFQHCTLENWRRNPQMHCDTAVQSILDLVIRNSDRLNRVNEAIESRLARIPDFLEQGVRCIRRPVPLWTKLAIRTCVNVPDFLRELEKQLLPLSSDPARTSRLCRDATKAFRNYAEFIADRPQGPNGSFALGTAGMEFMIRERTGLWYSLDEVRTIGERLIAQISTELKTEARRFGRKSPREIIENAAAEWRPSSDSLVSEYRQATEDVRQRLITAELLSIPEHEELQVVPVPKFLRHHFPTAAYLQPGAFAKRQIGTFWVNDLSADYTDPEKRRAEIRQHYGLELTCAHEAYPGHHLQFVIQNRHRSKLRRLFSHAIYYEGWTLWCERMCVERGIYRSPYARLIQLHDGLWRAYRIVIDCGLQNGTLSYKQACRKLMDGVGFTRSRAEGDVNWYTSSPTVPMSYLLGRIELEKLYAKLVGEYRWSLKRFNDWVLSFGAVPWSWIWQAQLRGAAP